MRYIINNCNMETPRKRLLNAGVRYPTVCLITEIYHTVVNKERNKFNFKEVIVCALKSLIQIK
jgi:hypothetical protein